MDLPNLYMGFGSSPKVLAEVLDMRRQPGAFFVFTVRLLGDDINNMRGVDDVFVYTVDCAPFKWRAAENLFEVVIHARPDRAETLLHSPSDKRLRSGLEGCGVGDKGIAPRKDIRVALHVSLHW